MKKIVFLLVLFIPTICFAEYKQIQKGDTILCVNEKDGKVRKCYTNESGELILGGFIITKDGKCPT